LFSTDDTIVAIATPPGRAGLGVVRISGPQSMAVAEQLLAKASGLAPRHATLTSVRDVFGSLSAGDGTRPRWLDSVVATFFPTPGSYTGDDTVEISAHGNPVVLERIVSSAIRAGARLARPGEFTFRAYLNGKLDLVQAEAVADLIDAVTPAQVKQAFDQLEGTLTRSIKVVSDRLFDLVVRLEASLDFPDEGYHFVEASEVATELGAVRDLITALLRSSRQGRVIREGRHVVLVGGPNVGKSSLFNALIGVDRAIVTAIPGTTRDLVTERCDIGGTPITLVDTAGLREAAEVVEREGISRTQSAASVASLVLLVVDRSRPLSEAQEALVLPIARDGLRVIIANKADLDAAWPLDDLDEAAIAASAQTGEGLEDVREAIVVALAGGEPLTEIPSVSNVRHIALLESSREAIERGEEQARAGAPEELILADVHEGIRALEEVVGRRTPDDVLAAIFDRFCIGK
jgi:tRNA modification GTPase